MDYEKRRLPWVEQKLDELFPNKWSIEEHRLGEVNDKASKAQQNRFARFYPDAVERYEEARRQGYELPIKTVHVQDGALIIDDGIHRFEADKAFLGDEWADAVEPFYVINPDTGDEKALDILRRWVNLQNGVPLDRADQEMLATTYLQQGYSMEQTAKNTSLKLSTVRRLRDDQRTDKRLRKLGLDPAQLPSKVIRTEIANKNVLDEHVPILFTMARDLKLQVKAVKNLLAEMREQSSSGDRTRFLNEKRAEHEADHTRVEAGIAAGTVPASSGEGASVPTHNALTAFNSAINLLRKLDGEDLTDILTDETRGPVLESIEDGIRTLRDLRKLIEQ